MEFELVSYRIHSPGMDPNNLPMEKIKVFSATQIWVQNMGFSSPLKNEEKLRGFSHGWWVTVPNPLVVTAGIEDIFDPRGGGDPIPVSKAWMVGKAPLETMGNPQLNLHF